MKQLFIVAIVLAATGFTVNTADPLSKAERKYAVDYFTKTKKQLLKKVNHLSAEQLAYKPGASGWSIAECIEHIALSEKFIWDWSYGSLQGDANPAKRGEVKITKEQIVQQLTDRSHKVNTIDPLQPGKKFESVKAALQAFTERRDATIQYLEKTQDDLKDHYIDHPAFGTINVYQNLVFLAAHTARHTLQIEEVMKDAGFPK